MKKAKSIVESGYLSGRPLLPTTDLVLSLQEEITNHKIQEIILDYCNIANMPLTIDMFVIHGEEDNRIFEGFIYTGFQQVFREQKICYGVEHESTGITIQFIYSQLKFLGVSKDSNTPDNTLITINQLAKQTDSQINFI